MPGFAAVMEVEGHDRQEHQDASHHREEEELDGRIDPVRAAPYPDEEVHGDQHQFPEDVEENEIQGAQGADHRRFQKEEGDVIFLDLVLDRLPGAEDAKDGEEGGEHHQEHADAVYAEKIADPPFREPLPLLDELHRGGLLVEMKEQRERQDKFQKRPDQDGHLYEKGIPPRQQHQQQGARQGEKDQGAQKRKCLVHVSSTSRLPTASPPKTSVSRQDIPPR